MELLNWQIIKLTKNLQTPLIKIETHAIGYHQKYDLFRIIN